ncbi:MAG: hypothetical protein ABSH08_19695 [Tepidisphaeraceae bacterium]
MRIPLVIPPKALVRLSRYDEATPGWRKQIGREFRVGYYSPQDGLECIWLVNDSGDYEQTTDRRRLLMYFDLLRLSHETDFFGEKRAPLGRRKQRRKAVA